MQDSYPINLPQLLTVAEVSKIFHVSKLTVKRWGKSGALIPIRINSRGDRRYNREDIVKLLENKPFPAQIG